jgi:hypothetical protein
MLGMLGAAAYAVNTSPDIRRTKGLPDRDREEERLVKLGLRAGLRLEIAACPVL